MNETKKRELDRNIVTEVFDYQDLIDACPRYQKPSVNGTQVLYDIPLYSGLMCEAWKVMEELIIKFPKAAWHIEQINTKKGVFWNVIFWGIFNDRTFVLEDDLAVAICKVALDVMRHHKKRLC
jgi:hypothetical protein